MLTNFLSESFFNRMIYHFLLGKYKIALSLNLRLLEQISEGFSENDRSEFRLKNLNFRPKK